ncbi:efflux RND transporter periplasmic adaptor subunit [Pseudomonas sp. S 311-6]|uniref:Hemolysin secretion protein D n=1 Tax=Kerstersia gyiorum TaxID=206506 RepID=A0A171KSW1_9BURK|nr:efflux RND transporter periplasmic adaptor subunit [Kerstersia gyiorum]MCO7639145.1 efflux RND transporter periplasmic adaptor subunit [Pseudomonas sp. S 311-6]KAB0542115.1 efflux RND transporter periplasmic adaptor subunit [Kerstersia gyiorum]KKO71978.1 hemolysin secretion protein D [Kerstersia gyiorum]MCR4158426.1 efflux RND transporter periplasmic adaptor subunit [Kerstersia gyiorum]RZS64919.1 macrolide-specific efflux system membrane fusion protein [Kerstersia gyiorum]
MARISRRWLLAGCGIAAAAAVAAASYPLLTSSGADSSFVTVPVRRAAIEDTVLATGTLQAYKQVDVGAQVSGQLVSLKVELGDRVEKGQLLAEIDSLPQENVLRNAQAGLASARAEQASRQAQLKQAELAHTRQKTMLAADASSREAYEAAVATLAAARAGLESVKAQVEQASVAVDTATLDLGYTRISAPIDGVVVGLSAEEGQTLNANQQTPTILTIAQLDTLTVKAQISEADVVRVAPGDPVYFTILGQPGQRRSAVLRAIEPAPESSTSSSSSSSSSTSSSSSSSSAVYYNGLFEVANPDGLLRIDMTAQVYIVLKQAEDALVIPSSALGASQPDGSYLVRVLNAQGRPEERHITIGMDNQIQAEVLSGLAVGDAVILGDASQLSSTGGMRRGPGMRL